MNDQTDKKGQNEMVERFPDDSQSEVEAMPLDPPIGQTAAVNEDDVQKQKQSEIVSHFPEASQSQIEATPLAPPSA